MKRVVGILPVLFIALLQGSPAAGQEFLRGDANGDGAVDVSDATTILGYLFLGTAAPDCLKTLDADDDGTVVITDPVYLLDYLFSGGAAPPPPFPGLGFDPTPDGLTCGTSSGFVQIDEAKFEDEDTDLEDRIVASGSSEGVSLVILRDDPTGLEIGTATPRGGGDWEVELFNPQLVPCVLRAEGALLSGQRVSDTEPVEDAPSDCGGPDNLPPNCDITLPVGPLAAGTTAVFTGIASDPEGEPLLVIWHFGGAVDSRVVLTVDSGEIMQVPVLFEFDGQAFRVTLTAIDDLGLRSHCRENILVGTPPPLAPSVQEEPAPVPPSESTHVVFAFNDLGMHCGDLGSVPFSILPPFNTVNAQVIERGIVPRILEGAEATLMYSAASNPNDLVVFDSSLEPPSINSTSANFPIGALADDAVLRKTDFWDLIDPATSVVEAIFGLDIPLDEGLPTIGNPGVGRRMPGFLDPFGQNAPQPFSGYVADHRWYAAEGIPFTPVDDFGRSNSYPLIRVEAFAPSGTRLAAIDAVVPNSTEVDCGDCHTRGEVGADPDARPSISFLEPTEDTRVARESAAKLNILSLHDSLHSTTLVDDNPVICASCHNSFALEEPTGGGLAGDPLLSPLSIALHGQHGKMIVDEASGVLLRDVDGNPRLTLDLSPGEARLLPSDPNDPFLTMEQNCFTCHPGKLTQCFRGAMFDAGLKCSSCHGDLLATGGQFTGDFDHNGTLRQRLPWRDEPRCESCHLGDALNPGPDSFLARIAFDEADRAAVPRHAANPRFAEESDELYRKSHGHGGVACEACHGSPHAIWPAPDPLANDNVPALQLQGHAGTIRDCGVCHSPNSFPNGTLAGPHGMHPVNDPNWIRSSGTYHKHFAQQSGPGGIDPCAPCHGADHRGTRLSRTPVAREFRDASGDLQAVVPAGTIIGCDMCHTLGTSFNN